MWKGGLITRQPIPGSVNNLFYYSLVFIKVFIENTKGNSMKIVI